MCILRKASRTNSGPCKERVTYRPNKLSPDSVETRNWKNTVLDVEPLQIESQGARDGKGIRDRGGRAQVDGGETIGSPYKR